MYENPMEINEGLLSKAPCVHLFFGFHFFHLESALFSAIPTVLPYYIVYVHKSSKEFVELSLKRKNNKGKTL